MYYVSAIVLKKNFHQKFSFDYALWFGIFPCNILEGRYTKWRQKLFVVFTDSYSRYCSELCPLSNFIFCFVRCMSTAFWK